MIVITIIICLISILFSFIEEKNFFNPKLLFNGVWFSVLALFKLHLFGITDVSSKIEFVIFLGVVSFNLGVLFFRHIKVYPNADYIPDIRVNINPVIKMLHIMQLMSAVSLSYGALLAIASIVNGASLTYYRYKLLTLVVRQGIYAYISLYIGEGLVFATVPLAMILVFFGYRKEAVTEALLFVEYFLFSGGGRNNLLVMIVTVYTCYCIFNKKIQLNKKVKKTVRILAIIALALMFIVPIIRGSNVYKSLYLYFCGTVKAFDVIVTKMNYQSTFGLLTLQGFLRPLYLIMKAMGSSIIGVLDQKYKMIDSVIQITDTEVWNSAITGIGFIYVDAGTIGVIVIMTIIGAVCMYLYKKVKILINNNDFYSISSVKYIGLYCFAVLLMVQMFADLASPNVRYGMGVIYFLIAVRIISRFDIKLSINK